MGFEYGLITIKDVAKAAGYSATTTSLVLSGKPESSRISADTRTRILDTAREMGYRANITARRLRANQSYILTVSVFMALDARAYGMMRFLRGLQGAIEKEKQPIELSIHSYKSGSLHTHIDVINLTGGAIICNASEDDLLFLDSANITVPIVLLLRKSEKYFAVNVNHSHIGEMAAGIFVKRGHKRAVIMDSTKYFAGMNYWTAQFAATAGHYGLSVSHTHSDNDTRGGYNGGLALCKMKPLPDCVFVVSNAIAIGALRAFHEKGIRIPEQMELISIGIDIADFEEFVHVSVSTIYIPLSKMAEECLRLLLMQLNSNNCEPYTLEVPVFYRRRESCGD